MLKKNYLEMGLEGNDRWEGFVIDLLHELSQQLGFDYMIKHVADSRHGSQNINGTWNGMIGEVIDGRVDIAASDLTITKKREAAVDFTVPFMNLGVSILYKKAKAGPQTLDMLYFVRPLRDLSNLVLLFLFLTVVLAAILVLLIRRGGTKIWYKCLIGLWFLLFFMFSVLYISNLTEEVIAGKALHVQANSFDSAEELSMQDDVAFGCMSSGSTRVFFHDSQLTTYKRVSNRMERDPSNFVRSNQEGVARVKAGGYAFFMESPSIEYIVQRDCDLVQVGGLLNSKNYGLAIALNSPLRKVLSQGILFLQESGVLVQIKDRWWSAGEC